MTHDPTPQVAALGTVAALIAGGPMAEVFNELGLVMATMGALGGGARALALEMPWRRGARGFFLGGLLAFGVGSLALPIVNKLTGIEIAPDTSGVQVMAAAAFLTGFLQERIINLRSEKRDE